MARYDKTKEVDVSVTCSACGNEEKVTVEMGIDMELEVIK